MFQVTFPRCPGECICEAGSGAMEADGGAPALRLAFYETAAMPAPASPPPPDIGDLSGLSLAAIARRVAVPLLVATAATIAVAWSQG